jgi:predicted double-glycine peptidase
MAYKYKDLEKESLKVIEKYKLFFIADVVSYLPCSYVTFYEHKLNESNAIKDALTKVKTDIKVSMRSKWYKSSNPTLQMGLMKLISSNEELKKLAMNHNVVEGGEKPIQNIISLGKGVKPDEIIK